MYLVPFAKFLGTKMGLRFLMLVIVGLGALYTIHLLAQDYMKISGGAKLAARFLLGKRDLTKANANRNVTFEKIEFEKKIDWDNVLNRDLFSCALSLVCQLSAGAEKKNVEANNIYEFLSNTLDNVKVPKKLKKAFENGYNYNKNLDEDFKNCYKDYPFCPYSAKTMIKIITFNNAVFG